MSLRVWMPLTGDLHNQGLSNVTATNSNATVDAAGKIGSCYKNTNSAQGIILNNFMPELKTYTNYSMCAWVYLTSNNPNGHSSTIISSGNWNSSNGCLCFGLYDYNEGYCRLLYPSKNSWAQSIALPNKIAINTWYHITITYNGSKTKAYINGEFVGEVSNGGICENSNTENVMIGSATYAAVFTLRGKYNDIRIYDHALSPKEVKEIAQGLVMHYPLDNILPAEMDIYEYIQSTGTQWIDTGYVLKGPFRIESDMELTQLQSFQTMYGFMISSSTITPRMGLHNYPQSTWMIGINDTVSFGTANTSRHKFVHTYENGTESIYIDGTLAKSNTKTTTELSSNAMSLGLFARNQNTVVNYSKMKLYSFKIYDNGILVRDMVPCSYKGTIGMYDRAGNKFYTNSGTGTFTLSSTKLYSYPNVVYDCSGYGNNGNVNGLITTSSDTSRYESSTKLPDSACAIGIGNLSTIVPEGIFTFNVWFKKVTGEWSSKSWETIFGGPSGFELEGKLSSTQNAYIHPYNWGGGSTTTPNSYSMAYDLDKWNMVTMVRNDTGTKFYINGEFKVNGSTRGSFPSGDYFIGAWKTATQQNFRGCFSDARIYATALSDADIKELYDTAASIDDGGNLHDFECVEDEVDKAQVFKTGVVKTNNFIEFNDKLKVLGDGSVFLQILHHNNPASNLFTVNNCWLNNTTDLYSALLLLKDSSWFTSLSEYEFLICEKLTSTGTESQYRWKQTSNPSTSSTLSGYSVISGSPARSCGLMNKGTYAAMHNGASWWAACGSYSAYQGGIPGVAGVITTGYLDLYVRIPDEMIKGALSDFLKMYKKSILGKQMIER